jgi:hypothetical protein
VSSFDLLAGHRKAEPDKRVGRLRVAGGLQPQPDSPNPHLVEVVQHDTDSPIDRRQFHESSPRALADRRPAGPSGAAVMAADNWHA